jgi:hypothetical protein
MSTFVCPSCSAEHQRGPLNGFDVWRCLACGWSGKPWSDVETHARALIECLRKYTGRTADWPVQIKVADDSEEVAQELVRVLTNLCRALNLNGKTPSRPKIVCICGSSRFIAEAAITKWEYEKQGVLALGMHLLPLGYPGVVEHHQAEHEGVAETLDELHLRKIEMADFVHVVNVGGYIGERTRYEIEYARTIGKPIEYREAVR